MKLEEIFTTEELAIIDSGEYRLGRAVLDAKLDLWAALEREACAKVCIETGATKGRSDDGLDMADYCAAAIRARGNT